MNLQRLTDNYLEYLHYEQLASSKTALVRTHELNKFRKYMEEVQGINTILGIKTHHLRSYISFLRTEKFYSAVSICNIISGLRAFYSYAVIKGIVAHNIARKIKKPHVEKKEVEYFTWEEVEKIFLALPWRSTYLRDLCILLLFYYTGVRLEEAAQIKVSDLSFDLSELYIEKGKGDKSRGLPVHPFLQKALRLYLKGLEGALYLFPNKAGDDHLSENRIYKIVKKCGERAGIEKRVSPHTFRHSFATHLHQKGVDIYRLKEMLGHANIEKTAIYTHTEDEELIEAVDKLG